MPRKPHPSCKCFYPLWRFPRRSSNSWAKRSSASGLHDQRLAVRSSALNEDLVGSSMAGHYRSVLGVRGMSALREAILTCWRSAFEASALAAHAKIESLDGLGMGVLIQPLIEADCSGVCFSLDPVQPENRQGGGLGRLGVRVWGGGGRYSHR